MHDATNWLVVHCRPRQEEVALENLCNQGFDCYLPRRRIQKLRRGKVTTLAEPLFSRYLFLREPDARHTSLAPVRSTRGVANLLRFGDQAARVGQPLVEALREQEALQGAAPIPYLRPGDAVQVTRGPLAGLQGVFEIADGEARAMVLIDLLGRSVKLALAPDVLRRAA